MNMIDALKLAFETGIYVRPVSWDKKAIYFPPGSKTPRIRNKKKWNLHYAFLPDINYCLEDWEEITPEELENEIQSYERSKREAYKARRFVFERAQ